MSAASCPRFEFLLRLFRGHTDVSFKSARRRYVWAKSERFDFFIEVTKLQPYHPIPGNISSHGTNFRHVFSRFDGRTSIWQLGHKSKSCKLGLSGLPRVGIFKIGPLREKLRPFKVRLNPLASNPRRDSYELCSLVAQPTMIRFCSYISYFLRLLLTKIIPFENIFLRNFPIAFPLSFVKRKIPIPNHVRIESSLSWDSCW